MRLMAKEPALRFKARRTVRLNGKRYAPGSFVPLAKADEDDVERIIAEDRVVLVDSNGFAIEGEE